MAELTIVPGRWYPDPDWFEGEPHHCPCCGQIAFEGDDIEEREITIECRKWVEARNEDGIWFLKPIIIEADVTCWFHAACWRIYVTRTGGA